MSHLLNRICKGFLILLALCIVEAAFGFPAVAGTTGWIDIWNNGAYYTTNGESPTFNTFLLRSEGRFGLQMVKLTEKSTISPYLVYLLAASPDPNYWNNFVAGGAGLRYYPLADVEGTSWANEWIPDIRLFLEVLGSDFLKNGATAEANGVPRHDVRYGVELYHEWNQDRPNRSVPWSELWANLSMRETNFYEAKFNTFLLTYQQYFGFYLGEAMPYLKLDLTYSGKDYSWQNVLMAGPGLRFEPFRHIDNPNPWIAKAKMFVEVLGVNWLKQKDNRPGSDLRFGVDWRIYI